MLNDVNSSFLKLRSDQSAEIRLFCLPSAGSGVAPWYSWLRGMPSFVELCPVQLPGRDDRRGEPSFVRMEPLVSAVADVLTPLANRRWALLGHSLGALTAFEIARELRRRGVPPPVRLFVSSRNAPQIPPRFSPIHQLSDSEFLDQLACRYGPIPATILAEPDLMKLFFPVLRSDIELLETYVYRQEQPFGFDISVFGGEGDASVDKGGLQAWAEQTAASVSLRMFPGDHFFPKAAGADFLKAISGDLAESLRKNSGC